jgi:hypothetical protein
MEWFADRAAMAAWDEWVADASGSAGGEGRASGADATIVDQATLTRILVEERTVFGAPWLDARWKDPGSGPTLLLIGMIEPAPGLSRPAFRDYWWDRHRPLANQMVPDHLEPVAYVHNYVYPDEPGWWAGIGEMYEQSLDTARGRGAWFESEEALPLVADEVRFLVRETRELLVTDQYVVTGA